MIFWNYFLKKKNLINKTMSWRNNCVARMSTQSVKKKYRSKNYSKYFWQRSRSLKKKNSMFIRVRKQLKSLIERKIYANREWNVNKKNFLSYFHAIYVFKETSLRFALLRFHYDDSLTKHYDNKKTLTLLERKFYWQRMRTNIDAYVQEYEIYQRTKTSRHRL